MDAQSRPVPATEPAAAPNSGTRENRLVALVAAWRRDPAGPCLLVTWRGPSGHLAGAPELPGGKVEAGETAAAAARRELLEETGLAVGTVDPLLTVRHSYAELDVQLCVFLSQLDAAAEVRPGVRHRWVPIGQLETLPWPAANGPITAAIVERLGC